MSRELAVAIVLGIGVLALVLMFVGWRRRAKRDVGLVAPLQGSGAVEARSTHTGFYVATTEHDRPLNRVVVRHLSFRSKVTVSVTDTGVLLAMPGEPTVAIDRERIVDVGRATWTIDRVVEKDGLVHLSWRIADDVVVDSYLRLQGTGADDLVIAVDQLTTPTPTGSDA